MENFDDKGRKRKGKMYQILEYKIFRRCYGLYFGL